MLNSRVTYKNTSIIDATEMIIKDKNDKVIATQGTIL